MKVVAKRRLELACDKGQEFEKTLRKLELVSKNRMIADILEIVQDLNNDLCSLLNDWEKKK